MTDRIETIRTRLFSMQDEAFRSFHCRLIPTVPKERVIGIRTPALRAYAKELSRQPEAEDFLAELPHRYYDEDNLHAFILAGMTDPAVCLAAVDRFLPFVDNWATCDQLRPKVFAKDRILLEPYIDRWLRSDHAFTVRFGIEMRMNLFLDDHFSPNHLEAIGSLRFDQDRKDAYYVNMMRAWYLAEALAKQYDSAVRLLESGSLDVWTHNKAIQKARESRRITPERKAYLRSLKRSED